MSRSLCLNAPFIPRDESDVVFSAPWEARAFAMVVKLHENGHFDWSEWVATFSAEVANAENGDHARQGHSDDYYECWLAAMEKLLAKHELITESGLNDEIARTLETWPHPDHVARREPVAVDPAS